MIPISFASVLVAAIVAFIIGFLMHGPIAGKLWMRLANITPTGNEKFSDMYGQMFMNLLANIVSAFILAAIYMFMSVSGYATPTPVVNGLICGFLVWSGFIVTNTSMDVIWMGKSFKLWMFETVSSLIVMLAMGAIIALW